MGAGTAIISTPYLHAKENLADNRGLFFDFEDSGSIANCLEKLLDEGLREEMAIKNYAYSRQFTWSKVAMEYAKLFERVSMPKKPVKKQTKKGVALEFAMPAT